MSWICIRVMRSDDRDKVQASAVRFAKRHGVTVQEHQTAWSAVEEFANFQEDFYQDGGYCRRLWERCFARAVGIKNATGVAWGTIGYESKGN